MILALLLAGGLVTVPAVELTVTVATPELAVAVVLVTAIANIGSSIPAAPGGIGLFELLARETLVLLPLATVDRSVAGGFAAVVHAALLLPMILLGQLFLWAEQVSFRKLSQAGRAGNAEQSEQAVQTAPLSVETEESQ